MDKSSGYFEQIPVAVVKRIADPIPEEKVNEGTGGTDVVGVPVADEARYESWQRLAEKAQAETDSKKVIDLVQQLIEKFDEEKMRAGRRVNSNPPPSRLGQ